MKAKKQTNEITKTMTIAETVAKHPETIPVLLQNGMHCIGCPMALQETLEEGLSAHGTDVDKVIKELNKKIKEKKK